MMWRTSCGRPCWEAKAAPEIGMAQQLAVPALDELPLFPLVFEELPDIMEDGAGKEHVPVDGDPLAVLLHQDLGDLERRERDRARVLDEADIGLRDEERERHHGQVLDRPAGLLHGFEPDAGRQLPELWSRR